jgi:hypothetical protein
VPDLLIRRFHTAMTHGGRCPLFDDPAVAMPIDRNLFFAPQRDTLLLQRINGAQGFLDRSKSGASQVHHCSKDLNDLE